MKVLIADDHNIVRAGISKLLKSAGFVKRVEEATDGRDVIEKARIFKPDLFVLDYEMPRYDAIYAATILQSKWPGVPILVLSVCLSGEHVMEAIRAGVNGIVYKDEHCEVLFAAIKALMDGKTWFKGHVAEVIAQEYSSENSSGNNTKIKKHSLLTKRELEIIRYLNDGYTSAEIAGMLYISRRTVEVHKANIFKKTGVNTTVKLLKYSITNNLISA